MADNVVTKCGACGQEDDHPKHVVHVGAAEVFDRQVFHPHDLDQDGYVEYHFDCDSEWAEEADQRAVAAAKSGIHGDELRAHLAGGN